jgi:hypothetical protein
MALTLTSLLVVVLCACHVYDEQCAPRNNPGGGVTVRASELDDVDAGTDAASDWVEARKL